MREDAMVMPELRFGLPVPSSEAPGLPQLAYVHDAGVGERYADPETRPLHVYIGAGNDRLREARR